MRETFVDESRVLIGKRLKLAGLGSAIYTTIAAIMYLTMFMHSIVLISRIGFALFCLGCTLTLAGIIGGQWCISHSKYTLEVPDFEPDHENDESNKS